MFLSVFFPSDLYECNMDLVKASRHKVNVIVWSALESFSLISHVMNLIFCGSWSDKGQHYANGTWAETGKPTMAIMLFRKGNTCFLFLKVNQNPTIATNRQENRSRTFESIQYRSQWRMRPAMFRNLYCACSSRWESANTFFIERYSLLLNNLYCIKRYRNKCKKRFTAVIHSSVAMWHSIIKTHPCHLRNHMASP